MKENKISKLKILTAVIILFIIVVYTISLNWTNDKQDNIYTDSDNNENISEKDQIDDFIKRIDELDISLEDIVEKLELE